MLKAVYDRLKKNSYIIILRVKYYFARFKYKISFPYRLVARIFPKKIPVRYIYTQLNIRRINRRKYFRRLYLVFFIAYVVLLLFYDMAEEKEGFLFLYEFHRWWE